MIFKIIKTESIKTKTGTPMSKATLANTNGEEFSNVTLFSPYTGNKEGENIAGELTPNDYNGKTGWKFKGETTSTVFAKKADNFVKNTEKVQAIISTNVAKAQDSKQDSIKVSSTFRDATILTEAWIAKVGTEFTTIEDIQKVWTEWRKWLLNNFDVQTPF